MANGSMVWHWDGKAATATAVAGKAPVTVSGTAPLKPARFGEAKQVEQGTTNLVTNPSFEVNTSGWVNDGGTLSRITSAAQAGTACGQIVTNNFTAGEGAYHAFGGAPGTQYTVSAFVRGTGGGTVQMRLWDEVAGFRVGSTVTLDGTWQRASVTATTGAGATSFRASVATPTTQAITYQLDAVQVEAKAAATSYCDGSLGDGHAWSGAAHASTSTRAASLVEAASPLDEARGAAAVWLRPLWAGGAGVERSVLHWRLDANNALHLHHTAAGNWRVEWLSGGASAAAQAPSTHPTGRDVLLVFNWAAATVGVSVDGGTLVEAARGAAPNLGQAATMTLGRRQDVAASYLDAVLGPVLLFDAPLTQAEVGQLAALLVAPAWQELSAVPNLLRMRERVRRDLRDEDAATQRWSDAELDRHIARALRDLSFAAPHEAVATLSTAAGSRVLDLTAVAPLVDRVSVDAVEYPTGVVPPCYVPFSLWGDTLTLHVDRLPAAGESVVVRYSALHSLTAAGSTLPRAFEDVVATGAAAYAALEWSSYATNRVNLGGAETWRQYHGWAQERLAAFHEALVKHGRGRRVRARRLYEPSNAAPSARPLGG